MYTFMKDNNLLDWLIAETILFKVTLIKLVENMTDYPPNEWTNKEKFFNLRAD